MLLYVPQLDENLMSCAALDVDGYSTHFEHGACRICREKDVVAHGSLFSGLYILNQYKNDLSVYVARSKSGAKSNAEHLWHRRFGHAYVRTLKEMATKGAVSSLSFSESPQNDVGCVPCVHGKQSRLSLKSRSSKAGSPGEVVFTDVCGPLPVESMSGKRYFVTFTDSFSSFKDVALMENKHETRESFIRFEAKFERKNDCNIKLVFSDNGGGYRGLVDYLSAKGIECEPSAPYTP